MIEILHLQIIQDFSEFVDQHRFWCHSAGCGPAGFHVLIPFPPPPHPRMFYCRCAIKSFDIVSGVIFNFTSQTLYIIVITLSKVAAIKFLTEKGVAWEIENEVSVDLKIHYSDLCKLYKVNCLIFIVRIENYIYIYIYYSN